MNNKTFNIIISPAKKMNINNDDIISESMPCFMDKTEYLYSNLKDYSYDDLKIRLQEGFDLLIKLREKYKNVDFREYKNVKKAEEE